MPLFTPEKRKRTAQNVSDMLESDERIDAVLIAGARIEDGRPLIRHRPSRRDRTPPSPEWVSEAGFAWHDVLHACAAVRRGRPWQSLWYLQRMRNRTLGLAQERHMWTADFFDRVDDLPDDELEPLQATLVATLEPGMLLNAIEAATRAFLEELRRGDENLAGRLEGPLLELVRMRE